MPSQADRLLAAAVTERLAEALSEAEAEQKQKEQEVEQAEERMHACTAAVGAKTRELDTLNRKLEHINATTPKGEDAGARCLGSNNAQ